MGFPSSFTALVFALLLTFLQFSKAANSHYLFNKTSALEAADVNGNNSAEILAAPLYPVSHSYLLEIAVGSLGKTRLVSFDTAVNMVWLQCSDYCRDCNPSQVGTSTTYYNASMSISYNPLSCDHPLCGAGDNHDQQVLAECMDGTCTFKVDSLDNNGGWVQGILGSDRISISDHFFFLFDTNIIFGCATVDHSKYTLDQYGSSGVVGLGLGKYSLPQQISVTRFSYCLPSWVKNELFSPPYVLFGSNAVLQGDMTPFLPGFPKYYLKLEGISYGIVRLDIFGSNAAAADQYHQQAQFCRGPYLPDAQFYAMSVESATFPLMLPSRAYELLEKEFEQDNPLLIKSRLQPMNTCYKGSVDDIADNATITLHFHGGIDLQLSRNATFMEITSMNGDQEERYVCLIVDKTVDGTAVLGLSPQLDHNIGFDLENKQISIYRKIC
ncbi:hypothetical protein OsJ_26421 [Oryza sativa Japonica Group]|uniref:Peptidase A1 domain-containing protein n=4 Tax=Oryza sativa subsp. japonica TaxID=39947 RepID=B9FZL6_ORYSJ|nr:hypothetical protein OsJ_26421 [Oryza sativa Japonica Group]